MTYDDYISKKLKNPSQASKHGGHFIEAFNKNKRSWFMRHYLGLESTRPKVGALRGSAVHAGIEAIYLHRNPEMDLAIQMEHTITTLLTEWLKDSEDDTRVNTIEDAITMGIDWLSSVYEADEVNSTLFGCEIGLEVALPNGFPFTCTIDRIRKNNATGNLVVRDTKTTKYILDTVKTSFAESDQVTGYLWAVREQYPNEHCNGAVGEIAWIEPRYGKQHRVECTDIIDRSKFELDGYADKLVGLYADLYSRLQLWPTVDPTHIELIWPYCHDDNDKWNDEYWGLKRLHPHDLERADVLATYGFVINETLRQNTRDFVRAWEPFDDGILGYLKERSLKEVTA